MRMLEEDKNGCGSAKLKERIAHDLIIRRVRQDELNKLVSVYLSAYEGLEEYAYTSGSEVRSYLRWLYRGDPDGFFVAELDGKVVGFVAVHTNWWDKRIGRTAEIHELVVHKKYQRIGIGTKLMECAIEHAIESGCNFVSLWVGSKNTVAREWYRRLGFEEVGEGYYWVRMIKCLSISHPERND